MRRLIRHAVIGTATSAVAIGAVLATVGPGLIKSADAPVSTSAAAGTSVRSERVSRGVDRPDLSRSGHQADKAALDKQSVIAHARTEKLSAQGKAIEQAAVEARHAEQQQRKVAEKMRKAAEQQRKAAGEKRVRTLGYQPETTEPREIGRQIAANTYGWGGDQFSCYDSLIMSESMWVVTATNASSAAYGIPQSLPGSKMASMGSDWRTNPATQIRWGLQYVKDVYRTPCSAWSFKQGHDWY